MTYIQPPFDHQVDSLLDKAEGWRHRYLDAALDAAEAFWIAEQRNPGHGCDALPGRLEELHAAVTLPALERRVGPGPARALLLRLAARGWVSVDEAAGVLRAAGGQSDGQSGGQSGGQEADGRRLETDGVRILRSLSLPPPIPPSPPRLSLAPD